MDNQLQKLKEKFETNNTIIMDDYDIGEEIQLTVVENKQNAGEPAFILPDGKIGFPSRNSIPVKIGDVILGKVEVIADHYAFIAAKEIIHSEGAAV